MDERSALQHAARLTPPQGPTNFNLNLARYNNHD